MSKNGKVSGGKNYKDNRYIPRFLEEGDVQGESGLTFVDGSSNIVIVDELEEAGMVTTIALEYLLNPSFNGSANYDFELSRFMNKQQLALASNEIKRCPGYAVTPLHSLSALAAQIGVGRIDYKDESERFGLGSFKALGGVYAVGKLLCREVGKRLDRILNVNDLLSDPEVREVCASLTVTTATNGNHGCSVAWGAYLFGCICTIYVHETVSEGRVKAIEAFGASVVRVPGDFDKAVLRADLDARENGWFIVSDTSYEGQLDIPCDVMQGYQLMIDEIVDTLEEMPTHIFVQAGGGGLAAAVCAYFWERMRENKPFFVVVEPKSFDSLYQSMKQGKIMSNKGNGQTIMAGLACGVPSTIAWEILSTGANAFCLVDDDAATEVMRLLAFPVGDDPVIVAGESAVAGLAAAIGAMQDAKTRVDLALDANSRILVLGTEGDTDPVLYQNIVGATAEQVLAGIKLV